MDNITHNKLGTRTANPNQCYLLRQLSDFIVIRCQPLKYLYFENIKSLQWKIDGGVTPVVVAVNDDVLSRKRFPEYWPFVREIHRSHPKTRNAQLWQFLLLACWTSCWINHWVVGDLRCHDDPVMSVWWNASVQVQQIVTNVWKQCHFKETQLWLCHIIDGSSNALTESWKINS